MKYDFKDVPPARRRAMQAIKRKNTKIELMLRRELFRRGYRYRIDYSGLPGRPDIVFVGKKIAIFCDSEFWHGKNWEAKKTKIESNKSYWIKKIEGNMERDKKVNQNLREKGWRVLRFWEKDIESNLIGVVEIIESELKSDRVCH